MPSFQFSLRLLLVGVTAACVLSALAAAYPARFVFSLLALVAISPALLVAALSAHKGRTCFLSLIGAFAGMLASAHWYGLPPYEVRSYLLQVALISFWAAGGALAAGGMALFIECVNRSRRREREP